MRDSEGMERGSLRSKRGMKEKASMGIDSEDAGSEIVWFGRLGKVHMEKRRRSRSKYRTADSGNECKIYMHSRTRRDDEY